MNARRNCFLYAAVIVLSSIHGQANAEEGAAEYLSKLQAEGRYSRDVY